MANQKIVLADDSLTIQKVVNLTFADEGYDVITFGNGDDAYADLMYETPDIVLADVNMPGLTGYQICEKLRQDPATASIPVVLLVGSFEPFDEAEASRVGANAFLTKPFHSIRQLVDLVHDLTAAKTSNAAEPVIQPPANITEDISAEPQVAAGDDIDRLYEDSFSTEDTLPDVIETSTEDLTDVGMDDEMIETSYAGIQDDTAELGSDMATVPGDENYEVEDENVIQHDFTSNANPEPAFAENRFELEQADQNEISLNEDPADVYKEFEAETKTYEIDNASLENDAYTISEDVNAAADHSDPWKPVVQQLSVPPVFEPEPISDNYSFETEQNVDDDIHTRDTEELPSTADLPLTDTGFQMSEPIEQASFNEGGFEVVEQHQQFEGEEPPVKQFGENDLLELPVLDTAGADAKIVNDENVIKQISPELLDLIVDKVLERLAQR